MAYKCIGRTWNPETEEFRHDYVLDSAADAASLPADSPGSVAIVADKDGAVYMVNASGEWREQ